MLKMNKISM